MDSIFFWLFVDDRRKGLSLFFMEEVVGSVVGIKRVLYLLSEFGVYYFLGLWRLRKRFIWVFGVKYKILERYTVNVGRFFN